MEIESEIDDNLDTEISIDMPVLKVIFLFYYYNLFIMFQIILLKYIYISI